VAEFMAGVDAYEAYPNSYRFYKYMNMITQAYNGAKLVIVGEGVDAGKLYIGSIGAGQSSQTTDKSENQEGYEHFYDDEYQDELMGEIFGDD